VAVMGASSFTYVEATWTQALGDRIGAHTAGRPASAKVGSRQPSATYRYQRAMGADCSRSPRAIDKAPVTANARASFNPNRASRAGEQLYHSDRMEAGEPRDLPGRVPGAFESQQLQISFHRGQISVTNGSYPFA